MINNQYRKMIQIVATIFATFLSISNVFPPIRGLSGYNYITLLSIVGWGLCAFILHPSYFTVFSKKPLHRLSIIIFICYTILVPYVFGNGIIGNRYYIYAQCLIFFMIYQFNAMYGYVKSNWFVLVTTIPFVVITSIITLYNLNLNPWLSRSIKSSGEQTSFLLSQGIGGYEFIYFLVFISIICIFLILNSKEVGLSKTINFISIVLFLLFLITIAYANFFTAIIMILLSLSIFIITKNYKIEFKVLSVGILLIFLINLKQTLLYVSNIFIKLLNDGYTVDRIIRLQNMLNGSQNTQSLLTERLPVYQNSIQSFIENPIGGKIITDEIYFSGSFLVGFGQHSQVLDTFALYGLLFGIINIYILLRPFFSRFSSHWLLDSFNKGILISVVTFFSLNNVSPSIGLAIFFIYPVIYDWLKLKTKSIL